MLSAAEDRLQLLFAPAAWRQGQLDYRQRRVNDLDYDAEERQLFGWVRGSNGQEYEVQVDFARASGPVIRCTCQESLCRHGAALLLQARQQLGAELVGRLLDQCGRSLAEVAEDEALRQFQQKLTPWLRCLELMLDTLEEVRLKGREDIPPRVPIAPGRSEFLLWQLDFTQNRLLARVVRRNGAGELEPPRPFIATAAVLAGESFACVDDLDRLLILWSDELGLLDSQNSAINLRRGYNAHNFLKWLACCDRLFLAGPTIRRVRWTDEPLTLTLRWLPDSRTQLRPQLQAAHEGKSWLLPGAPLLALRADAEGRYCLQPLANSLPPLPVVRQLLQAPPMPLAGLRLLQRQLPSVLRGLPGVDWPVVVARRAAKPVPVLCFACAPTREPRWQGAHAWLEFAYGREQIRADDLRPCLPGGDELLERDMADEARLQQQLNAFVDAEGKPAGSGIEQLQGWCTLMLRQLPLWRKQGWQVQMPDDFPLRLVACSEEAWFAELKAAEDGWFEAEIGVQLETPVALLPLLAAQLERLPSLEQLSQMAPDAPVLIELADGRQLVLRVDRLRVLLDSLLALFDRRRQKARVERAQMGWMLDLEALLPAAWQAPADARALGQALQQLAREGAPPLPEACIPGVDAELRDYQREGVAWLQFLHQYRLGGLLADDMGLGKTLQTLAHIALLNAQGRLSGPALVVAPTSLLGNWRAEAKRFTPALKSLIYHGADREQERYRLEQMDLVITSYGVVSRDALLLSERTFSLLVLDEAQAIKNPSAQVSRSVRQLKADQRLCLSGTPLENHLGELWAQFDFLVPGLLGARQQFQRRFRQPIERDQDQALLRQLRQRVAPFLLRRTKQVVASELPRKTEIDHPIHLDEAQRALYESVRASTEQSVQQLLLEQGFERSQIQVLDALTRLRQICCDPRLLQSDHGVQASAKLDELLRLVELMLEEGRRILIFSQFTSMLALIEQRLRSRHLAYVKLTGQTRDRDTPVQRFQAGEVPLFLLSLKAGGAGLNLTAADVVIHYDPWWNPAVEAQATDRAYRLGQDKPVFVYRLLVENSVEQKIQRLKARKQQLVAGLYGQDGQSQALFSAQELDWLLAEDDSSDLGSQQSEE